MGESNPDGVLSAALPPCALTGDSLGPQTGFFVNVV